MTIFPTRAVSAVFYVPFLVFIIAFAGTAMSATFVVTKTADTNDGICNSDCSLREAMAATAQTAESDVINFDPAVFSAPQTIVLTGGHLQTAETGGFTINGPGSSLLTISGNNSSRVLFISLEGGVVINNLRIANGRASGNENGGAILSHFATTALVNVVFENNVAGGEGGAIYNNGGNLSISGSSFLGNSAVLYGGAISIQTPGSAAPIVTITDSVFDGNTSTTRAGGAIYGAFSQYTLDVTDSTFNNNTASTGGGAVLGGGSFNNVSFTNNRALILYGGAIMGAPTIVNSRFNNNTAVSGGAVFFDCSNGSIRSVSGSVFSNNTASEDGGGIYDRRCKLLVEDTTISNNTANRNGGALYHDNPFSDMTIKRSKFTDNISVKDGGGIFNSSGILSIEQSLLARNFATSNTGEGGGAIYNSVATANLSNTTLANNSTSAKGAGVFNRGTVNLSNVTISGNQAASDGGGVHNYPIRTVNARNTLIGDNLVTTGSAHDFSGVLNSQGYNFVENFTDLVLTGIEEGNVFGRDPNLVPLKMNGGVIETVGLQPFSAAIDAGDPLNFSPTDQRGVIRSHDGDLDGTSLPDIGAYERQVASIVVTNTTDQNDGTCDSNCSLREAVQAANTALTPDNAILFEPSLFSVPNEITLQGGELVVLNNGTLIIQGPGTDLLSISGNSSGRVFAFRTNSNSALAGLTVRNGNGIGAFNSGFGGGLYFDGRYLGIRNVVLSSNSASNGGAVYSQSGKLDVANSSIISNSASLNGGAFFNQSPGTLIIENSQVSGNSGRGTGGVDNHGTLRITKSTIANNVGRGIINFGTGNADISNTTIANNIVANDNGGGIYNFGSILIRNSTISRNEARDVSSGGGIYNSATATIVNTSISGNVARSAGGIENTTGALSLVHATVAFNRASNCCGGGVRNSSGTVNVKNSLIAKNFSANGGLAPDFQGSLTSGGYNLLENTNGANITGETVGNILNRDAMIDPLLRDNGGATRTHALRFDSLAIDNGTFDMRSAVIDQREKPRPFDFPDKPNAPGGNGSDIGAYERQTSDVVQSVPFDFDGDGKTDISSFKPGPGEWWYLRSSDGGNRAFQFGAGTDVIVPADYTGDGKTDNAFFRNGEWFIQRSTDFSFYSFPFGNSTDTPVPADYDGDGKADAAVFRSSTGEWFVQRSSDGQVTVTGFGSSTDRPVPADIDGDGKADLAIFRPLGESGMGEWWYLRSSDGGNRAFAFGQATDKTVVGDYTGDGKADFAFFRPSNGTWYVLRSEDPSFYSFPFGTGTDIPAPGDYDGDGKTDAAVFRPSDTNWYVQRSTAGILIQQFGVPADKPVPGVYVR